MQHTVMEAENRTWNERSPSLNSMLPLQAHPAARVEHSTWRKMNEAHAQPLSTSYGLGVPGCMQSSANPPLLISQPEAINQGRSGGQAGQAGQSPGAASTASTANADR